MSARILITRPQPGAERTAERLREAGFEPIVLPLTKIERLFHKIPGSAFDGVVITSAQALPQQDASALAPLLDAPVLAVGETTARAAKESGFRSVTVGAGAVEGVVELVSQSVKPGGRLLYLCGRVRRPELEAELRDCGFVVEAVETYDAVPVTYSRVELASHLGVEPFDAVILMSAQTAIAFEAMRINPLYERLFDKSALVCFSGRIASVMKNMPVGKTVITREASGNSLMETLQSLFSG